MCGGRQGATYRSSWLPSLIASLLHALYTFLLLCSQNVLAARCFWVPSFSLTSLLTFTSTLWFLLHLTCLQLLVSFCPVNYPFLFLALLVWFTSILCAHLYSFLSFSVDSQSPHISVQWSFWINQYVLVKSKLFKVVGFGPLFALVENSAACHHMKHKVLL